jgi:outer membrane protein OmpA-like peptidoglycan-associated protein
MNRHIFRVMAVAAVVVLVAGAASYSSVPASADGAYHSVTFNENESLTDGVYAGQTADTTTDLTLFSNLNPSFSNSGMTFVNWNTSPNGSGTTYTDGESYDFDAPLTLYAIWVGPYVTVTFNENESSSDSTIASQTEDVSGSLTLFSNLTPSFANAGYTFVDWNTEENGDGTSYSNGAAYDFESPLALYAQWAAVPSVTATFNDNDGAGTIAPIIVPSGSTIALPLSADLTRTDFTLSGWNTAIDGSGTEYGPGASLVLTASATYYAQWTETSPLEVVIIDNGGTGSDPTLSGEAGTTVTLPGTTGLSDTGYTLTSWNTAANGSGTSYALGQVLTLTSPLTLYAQWTATPSSIKVNFSANGGSGSLEALSGEVGSTVTLPSASSVVRSGYTLTSWNTLANGSGTSYSPGQSLNLTSTLTLYAQWEKVPTSVLYGDVGVFGARSAALTASLKMQVRTLATTIKTRKYTKVDLFGFTAATGRTSLDKTLSSERANNVASYLRDELRAMEITGITISVSGQGSVDGKTNSTYSRVEVFVS